MLPARSPTPVTVVWTTSTPAASAAIEFATAIPKSSWKCASSGVSGSRSRTFSTQTGIACGVTPPNVSTSASASMCPSVATRSTRSRYQSNSAREESIVKKTV